MKKHFPVYFSTPFHFRFQSRLYFSLAPNLITSWCSSICKLTLLFLIFGFQPLMAQEKSEGSLAWSTSDGVLTGILKEGFHFNLDAPNQALFDGNTVKPSQASSVKVQYLVAGIKAGRVFAYVCDDANTFCERHLYVIGNAEKSNPKDIKTARTGKVAKVGKHGFIVDDFREALKQAKTSNRPILIDFSARWCPGCVRYEQEVFPTREFKAATAKFVKVKIDMDVFENQILAQRYGVRFIPTLVVVDANEKEIDRLVDFQPLGKLSAFLGIVNEDPTPIETLVANLATVRQVDRRRIGRRLLATGKYSDSITVLEGLSPVPPELLEARLSLARIGVKEGENGKAKFASALRAAIEVEPASFRSITWRSELIGSINSNEEKAKIVESGLAVADKMLSDGKLLAESAKSEDFGEGAGYEKLFVAMARADLVEASSASDEEKLKYWTLAAMVGRELKISTAKVGPSMRWLVILVQAKKFPEAEVLAKKLLASDKSNPELQRRLLRALVEQKKASEAIAVGKAALKGSYGRNEIWVVEQLAKAYIAAGRNQEARALLADYLNRPEINWANIKSNKKTLEELNSKIN